MSDNVSRSLGPAVLAALALLLGGLGVGLTVGSVVTPAPSVTALAPCWVPEDMP